MAAWMQKLVVGAERVLQHLNCSTWFNYVGPMQAYQLHMTVQCSATTVSESALTLFASMMYNAWSLLPTTTSARPQWAALHRLGRSEMSHMIPVAGPGLGV
jgi:hypothetical protein